MMMRFVLDMRDHDDIYMVIRLLYVYDMMRFVLCRKPVYVYETILYNTYTNTAKIRLEKEIENEKKYQ